MQHLSAIRAHCASPSRFQPISPMMTPIWIYQHNSSRVSLCTPRLCSCLARVVLLNASSGLVFILCLIVHLLHIVFSGASERAYLPSHPWMALRCQSYSRTLPFGERYPPRNFPVKLRLSYERARAVITNHPHDFMEQRHTNIVLLLCYAKG